MRKRKKPILFCISLLFCALGPTIPAAAPSRADETALPFFALNNGTGREDKTAEYQSDLLKETGYAGIGYSDVEGVEEMLRALDKNGLKMFTNYVGVDIDPTKPKYDPKLPETIRAMARHGAMVHLWVRGGKPSDASLDDRAVAILREVADMAHDAGLKVALYPHAGNWIESVEDAVRVAEKANRRNLGVTINLCHWLKVSGGENRDATLRAALPYLFVVTINGADADANAGDGRALDWDRLIQPLDSGSYDVYAFMKALVDLGYRGPVGLQSYAVQGDKRENLLRSIQAWRAMRARLLSE